MKSTRKTAPISKIRVDFDLNIRDKDNYDIPTIAQQILDAGRITTPLVVKPDPENEGHYIALQGNRRTLGGQDVYNRPDCPSDVKAALEKVEIVVYTDMTAAEELSLIVDQGAMKPISRAELLNTVWRMDRQFMSEQQIINGLYFNLAHYTGKTKKLVDVPAGKEARAKYLKDWFHGTVGNYMLSAAKMGQYVREQMYLTAKAEDGMLKPEHKNEHGETVPAQTVEMRCSRQRITELSAAKSADGKADGWNPETGGTQFNALIEKFKGEDAGTVETDKTKRPTVKELNDKADAARSPILRMALKTAAGDTDAGKGLFELDDRIYRLQLVTEVLSKQLSKITDVNCYKLVEAMLSNGPAADVERALKPFQTVEQIPVAEPINEQPAA